MNELSPAARLKAGVAVERNLSIMTGAELVTKYTETEDARITFEEILGKPVEEATAEHNPFWHYVLQTWYRRKIYQDLLYIPRHRDEVSKAVLMLATGELDKFDGVIHQYPRRALKSFFMKMMADWLPKRHKILEDMDILILYSHNLDKKAKAAMETVKNMNRHNRYIAKHFGESCRTVTGAPANFVIPRGEWGEKDQWDWPCRDPEFLADQKNISAEAALGKKAGAGYHYKLLDDWEAEDSRTSPTVRSQLEDRYDQLRQLNAPPWTREWVGGTPYHIDSLYRPMLEETHEDGTKRYYQIHCPALTDDNQPNFPTIPRLSVPALAKERANEINRRGTDRFFYLQYMLNPYLSGDQALQWEHFQPLTPEEFAVKFKNLPRFRSIYCDPAWKGDENHQKGSDAAIGAIDNYSIAGQIDSVLLDLSVSNDWESDEGADEIIRQMNKWRTHFYSIEQQADKPMVGFMKRIWRSLPRAARPSTMPRFIDLKKWSKKAKADRISTVAGHAKTGHWYYLTTIPEESLAVLRKTVKQYPAAAKWDTLDLMAQANSDEILHRYVPVAVPYEEEKVTRPPVEYASRYTGLPAISIH